MFRHLIGHARSVTTSARRKQFVGSCVVAVTVVAITTSALMLVRISSSTALAMHSSSINAEVKKVEAEWIANLHVQDAWHCIAPKSEVLIVDKCLGCKETLQMPYGGLVSKTPSFKKLVVFTSEPSQPWYKSALKIGTGVAIGAAAVAAAPAVLGVSLGVSSAGPVAGGLMAKTMAAGGAGGALSAAQSVAMGGVASTSVAGGGAAGGVLSSFGFGRKPNDFTMQNLPRSDIHICGKSGKVYIGIDIPETSEVDIRNFTAVTEEPRYWR
eukprot:TRINITY_DN2543_c0_g1_i1.p1 TRINITY_DN2543_c0_g1~~TRINITY_DN2543_c0_g1_i1.p1  ORF type:complete len:269 (-),score=51.44 TRINITY_DN2543_c0_g1_i1:249-1055(-)